MLFDLLTGFVHLCHFLLECFFARKCVFGGKQIFLPFFCFSKLSQPVIDCRVLKTDIDCLWNKISMLYSYKTDSDWSSGKIKSILEEISLRATAMRNSLMP